jgi:hypothetical protein
MCSIWERSHGWETVTHFTMGGTGCEACPLLYLRTFLERPGSVQAGLSGATIASLQGVAACMQGNAAQAPNQFQAVEVLQ